MHALFLASFYAYLSYLAIYHKCRNDTSHVAKLMSMLFNKKYYLSFKVLHHLKEYTALKLLKECSRSLNEQSLRRLLKNLRQCVEWRTIFSCHCIFGYY